MYGLSFGDMTFDLGQRSKVKKPILVNFSKNMRGRDSIYITNLLEIMYWLLFGVMTCDLGPRSRSKMILSQISQRLLSIVVPSEHTTI